MNKYRATRDCFSGKKRRFATTHCFVKQKNVKTLASAQIKTALRLRSLTLPPLWVKPHNDKVAGAPSAQGKTTQ